MMDNARNTILVVDDEEGILEISEEYFMRKGYHVLTAANGVEAIEVIRNNKIGCCFTDINMPEMDGTKCAQLIIEHDPDARIVLVSGYDEKGADGLSDEEKGLIKNYLTKPVDMSKLSRILAQLFE